MPDDTTRAIANATDEADFILKCMKLSEERGAYHILALRLRENEAEFRATASSGQTREFELLRQRAGAALKQERVSDRGSLLRLEHPLNQVLVKTGVMKLESLLGHGVQRSLR